MFRKHFCRIAISFLLGGMASCAVAQTMNRPDPLLGQVKDFLRQKKPLQAIDLLSKALKQKPNEPQFWLALGYAQESAKKLPEALAAFRQAQKLNPKFPGIENRIKGLEGLLKQDQVQAPNPGQPEARTPEQQKAAELMRSAIREKSYGRFEEAFQFFIQAAELDNTYLGGNDEGIIRAALTFYKEKLDQGDLSAELYYSIYRDFQGDSDIAERGLNAFLGRNPPAEKAVVARNHLERILARTKRLDSMTQAARSMDTTISPTPGVASPTLKPISANSPSKQVPGKVASDNAAPAVAITSREYLSSIADPTPVKQSKHPLTDTLIQQAKSDDLEESANALWRMGDLQIATPESLALIAEGMKSEDRVKMVTSMEAAERMGEKAAPILPNILEAVRGDDQYRKFNALVALKRLHIQPETVIPVLIQDLNHDNNAVANSAMAAIVAYGQDALPYLLETSKDPSSPHQKQAISAISQISTNMH